MTTVGLKVCKNRLYLLKQVAAAFTVPPSALVFYPALVFVLAFHSMSCFEKWSIRCFVFTQLNIIRSFSEYCVGFKIRAKSTTVKIQLLTKTSAVLNASACENLYLETDSFILESPFQDLQLQPVFYSKPAQTLSVRLVILKELTITVFVNIFMGQQAVSPASVDG